MLYDDQVYSSNAGGGGERVLWGAIVYLQRTQPDIISVIYTGDKGVTKDGIISKVKVKLYCGLLLHPRLTHGSSQDLA